MYFAEPSAPARRLMWHALSLGSVTRDEPERHAGYDKPGVFLFWVVEGFGHLGVPNEVDVLDRPRPGTPARPRLGRAAQNTAGSDVERGAR